MPQITECSLATRLRITKDFAKFYDFIYFNVIICAILIVRVSPLKFSQLGLDNRLLKALQVQNLSEPTKIQENSIPYAISGRDILASSKTGSGKTLAFLLPALHRMLKNKALSPKGPRCLILTPTRELAKQVFRELRIILKNLSYDAGLIVGGENFNDQVKALKKQPRIIVATPGRFVDHLEHKSLFIDCLELLIFDEADRMLDLGFSEQLKTINQFASHRKRQTFLFSATLDDDKVLLLANDFLNDPKRIAIGSANDLHTDITQTFYFADNLTHKEAVLEKIIATIDHKKIIIFTATRDDTNRLAQKLCDMKLKSHGLSGTLSQSQRNDVLSQFERGVFKILVTTDVASRGLDILNVSHVINFDLPKHAEEYVHRIGRTGRAGNKGSAFSIVGPKDWNSFEKIKLFLNQPIEPISLEGLEGKFKGIKKKPTKVKSHKTNKESAANHKKESHKKKTKATDKSFYTNISVGDNVFIPKKNNA